LRFCRVSDDSHDVSSKQALCKLPQVFAVADLVFRQAMKTSLHVSMKQQIIVAVVTAVLVGGSAPWWWSKLFPPPANTRDVENSSPSSPTPSPATAEKSAKPQPSPQMRQVQPIVEPFSLEEDQSRATADGAIRVYLFKIFSNRRGAAFTFDIDGRHDSHVHEVFIGGQVIVLSRGNNYVVRLLELRGDAGVIEVSHAARDSKLHSKLLIKGSYNEVYFYWDPNITVRVHEPFTVTAENQHTHIALPDDIPIDIEFAGHDNTVWCQYGPMVGKVVGDGLDGNRFQVRKDDK
jgi:hypothetical protein